MGMLSALFASLRARFSKILFKLSVFTNAQFWRTQGLVLLRSFFAKLLDVKPRDKYDYYTVTRWMISKKLAFAAAVIVGVLALVYILVLSPVAVIADSSSTNKSVPAYSYNSIPLRFIDGNVRIKARAGYSAYEGAVKKGKVEGTGKLMDPNGEIIYQGEFADNMYNGEGRLFYPGGVVQYSGGFKSNLYSGKGVLYTDAGVMRYDGEFENGMKNGEGTLYGGGGETVFKGNFASDDILYQEIAGMSSDDLGSAYTG
jgi:hypothetical protein